MKHHSCTRKGTSGLNKILRQSAPMTGPRLSYHSHGHPSLKRKGINSLLHSCRRIKSIVPVKRNMFSPRSSRVYWLCKVFCTLQMDDTVLTMTGRAERPGEGRLQEKETETTEQGKGVAHLLRPSKAPHQSQNANPFYFPLTLMEITWFLTSTTRKLAFAKISTKSFTC